MLEKFKSNILFKKLLKRPNIDKAYAMVKPTDSWYDTITKVHHSLHLIRQLPHEELQITSHDGLKLKGIYGREMYETWYKMKAMVEAGFPLEKIITHRFDAKDYVQGFEAMISGRSGKVILNWENMD